MAHSRPDAIGLQVGPEKGLVGGCVKQKCGKMMHDVFLHRSRPHSITHINFLSSFFFYVLP